MTRILILGGTTEATNLAKELARCDGIEPILSLAGRTLNPKPVPVPVRTGGFGGVVGLSAYLQSERIDLVIDATHPFAAIISANAIAACQEADVPLIAIERPSWQQSGADRWICVENNFGAVAALPEEPKTVFLGVGRLTLSDYAARPQHHYIARVIDPPEPVDLPHLTLIYGRGPFTQGDDIALFEAHNIEMVIAKNAGGTATFSKILAARALNLPVIMIDRPFIPPRDVVESVAAALDRILAHHNSRTKRGV